MKKILIIEDEADIRKVLRKRLESAGFTVVIAEEGYQGVQLIHQEKPDLVVLDLMLPTGDGLSVLKNMRLSAHTRDIPVIVVTGSQNPDTKQDIEQEGVAGFFNKPYDPQELIAAIRAAIDVGGN